MEPTDIARDAPDLFAKNRKSLGARKRFYIPNPFHLPVLGLKKAICLMLIAVLAPLAACSNETPPPGESMENPVSAREERSESSASAPESGETQAGTEGGSEVWELPLDCEYVPLDLDAGAVRHGGIFEIGDKVLVSTQDGNISAYSPETGEQLYSFYTGISDEGEQMYKSSEKEGFDYCRLFDDRIVYYNSDVPSKTLVEELPDEMKNDLSSVDFFPHYSENEAYFVWANKKGIMLMDRKTGESRRILDNADIETEVVKTVKKALFSHSTIKGSAPFFYFEPRLICGGTKVVAQATSSDYLYWAFVVYDLAQDKIETGFSYLENWSPGYPIFDRYVFLRTNVREAGILKITDAETGESEDFAFDSRGTGAIPLTEDCAAFLIVKWSSIENTGLRTYLCFRDDLWDESRPLFSVTDEETSAYIEEISENYIYVHLSKNQAEDQALCAVKYAL